MTARRVGVVSDPVAFPGTVQVGPHVYTIVVDRKRAIDASVTYGFTHPDWSEIILGPDQCLSQQRDTVLHELLHALLALVGVNKGGDRALLPEEDDEERLVTALSPLLLDTLRRNPDLTAFLLDGAS